MYFFDISLFLFLSLSTLTTLSVFNSTFAGFSLVLVLSLPCMLKRKVTSSRYRFKALDSLDINAIDSNFNFCITLDTLDMKPINHNSD